MLEEEREESSEERNNRAKNEPQNSDEDTRSNQINIFVGGSEEEKKCKKTYLQIVC